METLGLIFTLIAALLHLGFFALETFLWTTPLGLKVFKLKQESARSSQTLAANQGVYNALLAAGLFLSFILSDPTSAATLRTYCLLYIVIVGCYGAYSLKNIRVFPIHALPALIALLCFL